MHLQLTPPVRHYPSSSWLFLATSLLLVSLQLPSTVASWALKPLSTPSDLAHGINSNAKTSNISLGFDLSPSYGVVSIVSNGQYQNGSHAYHGLFHARVEGDEEYRRVMRRLADPKMQHLASMADSFRDAPRLYKREALKSIGLPASPEVAALAGMLSSLRARVVHWKQQQRGGVLAGDSNERQEASSSPALANMPRAALKQDQQQRPLTPQDYDNDYAADIPATATTTHPHLPALYYEDIRDAHLHADIGFFKDERLLPFTPKAGLLYHSAALQALSNTTTSHEHLTPTSKVPLTQKRTLFAVGRYANALTISMPIVDPEFKLWEPEYRAAAYFDLGAEREWGPEYWVDVRLALEPGERGWMWMHGRPVVRVFGDRGNARVREVVEAVVEDAEREIEGRSDGDFQGAETAGLETSSTSTGQYEDEDHDDVYVPVQGTADGAAILAYKYRYGF